jgi:hypothetical protein
MPTRNRTAANTEPLMVKPSATVSRPHVRRMRANQILAPNLCAASALGISKNE